VQNPGANPPYLVFVALGLGIVTFVEMEKAAGLKCEDAGNQKPTLKDQIVVSFVE
jgi:hypothetical protein